MQYAYNVTHDGIIYSLDMLRLRMYISEYMLKKLNSEYFEDEEFKRVKKTVNNDTYFRWRHFFSCTYGIDATLKFGCYMNGVRNDNKTAGFIEFNPNRFAENNIFWEDYKKMQEYIRYPEISRFDLAIDINIPRDKIAIIKDNRGYECKKNSAVDFTEYLGKRNSVGRCKLYNKQLESSLPYPLTRLEVTGDLDNLNVPKIVDLRNLPSSDSQVVSLVLNNDCFTLALSNVSQYHRGRIIKLITDNLICLDEASIQSVIGYAKKLSEFKY